MDAGLATQREIVNIQGDVSESEKNFINSIMEYNISLAELERISFLKKKDICQIKQKEIGEQNREFYLFVLKNSFNSSCG